MMSLLVPFRGGAKSRPAIARRLTSCVAGAIFFLSAASAHATNYVWTEDSFNYSRYPDLTQAQRNYSWENEYNWDVRGVPSAGDTVLIPEDKIVFIGANVTVQNLTVDGAQLDGSEISPGVRPSLTVTGTLNLNANAGKSGTLSFNKFNPLNIPAGAVMNMTGAGTKFVGAPVVNNQGTVNWTGTGNVRSTSTWNNSGTFNAITDGFFGYDDSRVLPVFNNTGSLIKSSGTGNSSFNGFNGGYISTIVNNSGRIESHSGTLTIGDGVSTGIFKTLAGATIKINGSHQLNGADFPGQGTVVLENGSLGLSGNINVGSTLEHRSGRVTANNTQFSGTGQYVWTSGEAYGNFKMPAGFTTRWPGTAGRTLGGTIDNSGTLIWAGNGTIVGNNGVLNNLAGGIFDIRGDGQLVSYAGMYIFTLNNAGTMVKSGGTGVTRFDYGSFVTSGTVELRSGTFQVASPTYYQTAGNTILNGGTLGNNTNTSGGYQVRIAGGYLSGRGLVNADVVNEGVVSPGLGKDLGIINIAGSYTQSSTGKLVIKVGGRDAALKQYGQIKAAGGASLNGNVTTKWINGFLPSARDSFKIIQHNGSSGNFSSVTSSLSDGRTLKAFYHPNDVSLGIPLSISGRAVQWVWDGTAFAKQGIEGTNVTVTGPNGFTQTITTNGTGNYSVGGLEPGTYTASAVKEGVTFDTSSQTVALPTRGIAGVSPNAVIGFRTFTIRVRVVKNDGTPLAGVVVTLDPNKAGIASIAVPTNAKGFATFSNLGRDTYTITPAPVEGLTYNVATRNIALPTIGVAGISPNATTKFTASPSAGGLTASPSGNAF